MLLRYSDGAVLGSLRLVALVISGIVASSYLPRMSWAWRIPRDSFFVGRAEAGGGASLLSGGIQLAMDVLMLPSLSQRTTRWSPLGVGVEGDFGGGCRRGDVGGIGGRRGVVVRGDGALSGGFSSGRALLDPGLGSQTDGVGVGVISPRTLVR